MKRFIMLMSCACLASTANASAAICYNPDDARANGPRSIAYQQSAFRDSIPQIPASIGPTLSDYTLSAHKGLELSGSAAADSSALGSIYTAANLLQREKPFRVDTGLRDLLQGNSAVTIKAYHIATDYPKIEPIKPLALEEWHIESSSARKNAAASASLQIVYEDHSRERMLKAGALFVFLCLLGRK